MHSPRRVHASRRGAIGHAHSKSRKTATTPPREALTHVATAETCHWFMRFHIISTHLHLFCSKLSQSIGSKCRQSQRLGQSIGCRKAWLKVSAMAKVGSKCGVWQSVSNERAKTGHVSPREGGPRVIRGRAGVRVPVPRRLLRSRLPASPGVALRPRVAERGAGTSFSQCTQSQKTNTTHYVCAMTQVSLG